MLTLILEASTSAAKALLYDDRRGVVGSASENYGHDIDKGGLHDARAVYRLMLRLGKEIAAGHDIAAIALSCVWHTVMACDPDMNPVTPVHVWNYTGAAEISSRFRADEKRAREIYRRTGCMPHVTYPLYSILLMESRGLDPKGKLFVTQGGFNFHGLTGRRAETLNVACGMGLVNLQTRQYDAELLELCGIGASQLGEIVTYRDSAPLLPEAAKALGVRAGIPVVPHLADGALNQVGNGAMRPGQMTFSVGTSAAIRLSTEIPVLSDPPATWCYAGVENWMSGAATNGACNCINWFKECLLGNRWSFEELSRGLDARTDAPLFLPFLFGERCPGWNDERLGSFVDLNGQADAATLFRSVSEGILFNVFLCYRILTALAGVPERIVLSGGILNSPGWVQMAADIFQTPMHISDNPDASMLGAAALALNAAGGLDDIAAFGSDELKKVEPRSGPAEFYAERFARFMRHYGDQNFDFQKKASS